MFARLPLLTTLLVVLACVASPTLAAPTSAPAIAQRWIIELSDPPLAQAPGISPGGGSFSIQSQSPPTPGGRLQINSLRAQEYRSMLEANQSDLFTRLQGVFPAAQIQRRYSVLLNGFAVHIPRADAAAIERLRTLPGVAAVYPEVELTPTMFSSIPQIGADVLWSNPAIGGQARAGEGIKIAIVDAGIKIDNPFFNPAGFSYPAGFPKGDAAHTTPKVIAARAYFRPDRPPLPGSETPQPGPNDSGHGTHVAGIAGGVAGTEATIAGATRTISGVAPRAYLMNYKVFYANETPFTSGSSIEFIAALEDAVKDGADVINNSWGSLATVDPAFNPIVKAAEAAVDAGVTVVFSQGNAGPDESTAGSPSYSEKLISVGATTTGQTLAVNFVDVVAPADAPDTLRERPYGEAVFGPQISDVPFGPASFVPVTALGGSGLACEPLPANTLTGRIALVERGVCGFSVKVFYAQQAGASAVMIYNSEAGGEEVIGMAAGPGADLITIPSIFIPRSLGVGMVELYGQAGGSAKVQIDPRARVIERAADLLAPFSSRGPAFQGSLKPDLVAPGVNILSSGFGAGEGVESHTGFGVTSGTSMASPHVAGAAALLKQIHPNWTPLDIKSALMATASSDVWLDEEQSERAGVLEQGAGRIDLRRAATPGLLFDRPALSFGQLTPVVGQPTSATLAVTARNVTAEQQTYALSARATAGEFDVAVSPASITVGPGATASFEVSITLPAGVEPSDFEGIVELQGPQLLHLPLWTRSLPAEQGTKVLLLDNDGSSSFELPDYSGYYGNALSELNIPFTYLDLDALAGQPQTLPPIGELQKHEIVIWFTGDNFVPSGTGNVSLPLTPIDQNLLLAYLQSGGRMIATGQNLAQASDIENTPPDDPRYFRSDLYSYFGAEFVQENVFTNTADLALTATGTGSAPWLENITLNFSAPASAELAPGDATGAGNAISIDEVRLPDIDPRLADEESTVKPLFIAASPSRQANGLLGVNDSAEPSLEEPGIPFPYRTTYLSFGLESVRSDTGTTTRKELLQALLYWTVDRPTVAISGAGIVGADLRPVTFSANAQSNTPTTFVRYRWDFGDGSPIVETDQATVDHQYTAPGSYTVRVEVTNSWGHRAVAVRTP